MGFIHEVDVSWGMVKGSQEWSCAFHSLGILKEKTGRWEDFHLHLAFSRRFVQSRSASYYPSASLVQWGICSRSGCKAAAGYQERFGTRPLVSERMQQSDASPCLLKSIVNINDGAERHIWLHTAPLPLQGVCFFCIFFSGPKTPPQQSFYTLSSFLIISFYQATLWLVSGDKQGVAKQAHAIF